MKNQNIKEITPKEMQCGFGACPAILSDKEENYFLIGKKVNPEDLDLTERIGKDEVLIQVPKKLIDDRGKI